MFAILSFFIVIARIALHAANIHATGVRKYPDPIGWVAVMPVEDRADVGSFWSGYSKEEPNLKRPRRVDETIGNQAGELVTLIHTDPLLYNYSAVTMPFIFI